MTPPRHSDTAWSTSGLRYYVLVLRIWQEADRTEPAWRFSLESLQATDRRGFASLEALIEHLRALTAEPGQS